MQPHALTLAYVQAARERPGMFYADHDISDLEQQLHGFDAAISAACLLGGRPTFNRAFSLYVTQCTGLSSSRGWAKAFLREYGRTARAEEAFWQLVADFLAQQ